MFDFFKTSPSKKRTFKLNEYLDTKGLKKILFPVLERHYPKNALNILKTSDDLLYGTPYFAYIFMLQKYDYLTCNSDFSKIPLKEKLEHLIIDRGAGNDTAFSLKEKEEMLSKSISDYNDVILSIIDCEQSRSDGSYGYPWDLREFIDIAKEIEKAYLLYREIKSVNNK